MKVKDLIKQEIDIDVYDDVCEELGIAFCGPMVLTEQGKEHFAEVLDYDISFVNGGDVACVNVDAPEGIWQKRLKKAMEFFEAAAGYCADKDYRKWFKEV